MAAKGRSARSFSFTKEWYNTGPAGSPPAQNSKGTPPPSAETSATSATSATNEHKGFTINPFPLLAHATENIDLSARLRAFSNNFAVIGALWCTLSLTALTMHPLDDVYKETHRLGGAAVTDCVGGTPPAANATRRRTHVTPPDRIVRQPILVAYLGIPEQYLQDIYMACWSLSFFTSALGLALSTVVAGVVASTVPSYAKLFVRRHSDILLALPILQGVSSGLAGVGLSVGIDEARGEPVAWIGYLGTVTGGVIVGRSTMNVLRGYNASRAAGKFNISPPQKPKM